MEELYLLGDSITQGLGSKKINFTDELARRLGPDYAVMNLAYTGTTIDYPNKLVDEGSINQGSTVVILYGNVDAQIRPNSKGTVFKKIPRRYQGGGMLMPRPFYSHTFYKKALQHVDNVERKLISGVIKLVDGTEQWVLCDEFRDQYNDLISKLRSLDCRVICCSTVFIDEKLFPGTPRQYIKYNEIIRSMANTYSAPYVDLYEAFETVVKEHGWDAFYNKDHFHPNGLGYSLIADVLSREILMKGNRANQ